jgi:hypothetical protein
MALKLLSGFDILRIPALPRRAEHNIGQLAQLLAEAWKRVLPDGRTIDHDGIDSRGCDRGYYRK